MLKFYFCLRFLLMALACSTLGQLTQAQTITQSFTYTGQLVTLPLPAGIVSLTIEARGAQGGNGHGDAGLGAIITGAVAVGGGQALKVLVGQHLSGSTGGGGGSFVTDANNNPLVIAGGGGGSSGGTDNPTNKDGQAGTSGANGAGANPGIGGSNGQGASTTALGGFSAGNGGGLLTNGVGFSGNLNGRAFINGGAGGVNGGSLNGGFGGGGAGGPYNGGGGGGYSGGGSGGAGSVGVGGGGGSFNADPSGTNTAGANSGNGLVIISYVVQPCAPYTPSIITQATPDGLAVQVSGGVRYERLKTVDRINGYEIRATEQNTTGYFLITQSGPYSITATDANGCQATVTGSF